MESAGDVGGAVKAEIIRSSIACRSQRSIVGIHSMYQTWSLLLATAVQEEQGVLANLGARHLGWFVVDDCAVAPVGRYRLEAVPPRVFLL